MKQRYQLEPEYKMIQLQILMSLNPAEIKSQARRNLDINRMAIVVVGDRATVKDKLNSWGYEVIELDNEGNEIKK